MTDKGQECPVLPQGHGGGSVLVPLNTVVKEFKGETYRWTPSRKSKY